MKTESLPFKISIATPCPARWIDMNGDDRVRFCTLCQKNVYNLSTMTNREVVDIVQEKEGRMCVRMFKRTDDTALAADCTFGVTLYWRRLKTLVCTGVASILFTMGLTAAIDRDEDSDGSRNDLRDRLSDLFDNSCGKVLEFFGIESRAHAKGGMAIVIPQTPPPGTSAAPLPAESSDKG